MELVNGAKKRITGKSFELKENGLCGKIIKSNEYIVKVQFNTGKLKIYTRNEFEKVALVINKRPQKHILPATEEKNFKNRCFNIIKNYINTHYKRDNILFDKVSRQTIVVYFEGKRCGEMRIDQKRLIIKFKRPLSPPNISKYKTYVDWFGRDNYIFTDLSEETISAIKLTVNWLLLCGKEKSQ